MASEEHGDLNPEHKHFNADSDTATMKNQAAVRACSLAKSPFCLIWRTKVFGKTAAKMMKGQEVSPGKNAVGEFIWKRDVANTSVFAVGEFPCRWGNFLGEFIPW